MSPTLPDSRPVPRWVHIWSIATVVAATSLLALGSLVTSYRVGMADPLWPTEPWYLFFIDWREPSAGFLIEHIHRLAGFVVGAFVSVLAVGLWLTEPRRGLKWVGLVSLFVLLAGFGEFHRLMMAQKEAVQVVWPMRPLVMMAGSIVALMAIGVTGWILRIPQSGLRLVGLVALLAVMVQGLLGGLRVRFNELVGTDLAAVHGIFGQVVFCTLVSIVILTAKLRPTNDIASSARRGLSLVSITLVLSAFLQLVWGAMVRHHGSPLMQRLHFLTAFIVFGIALALIGMIAKGAGRQRLHRTAHLLMGCLCLQIILGVEAWMGKFYGTLTPGLDPVTSSKALVRSLHVLVGTAVFALSTCLAVLIHQRVRVARSAPVEPAERERYEPAVPVGGTV